METDDDDDPHKSESWACGVLVSRYVSSGHGPNDHSEAYKHN